MDPISQTILLGQNRSDTYWIVTLGAVGTNERANKIALDTSENIYIVGTLQGANQDILIAKYTKNGNLSWQRSLGSTEADTGYAIEADSSGNVYIGGVHVVPSVSATQAYVLAKYDTNGILQWQKVEGGSTNATYTIAYDLIRALKLDSAGNIYAAIGHYGGLNYSGTNSYDALIRKFDSSGNVLWSKTIGNNVTNCPDIILGIVLDSSQNPIASGYTGGSGAASARNIFYYKVDSTGTTVTTDSFDGGSNTQEDTANDLAIDSQDNVYIAGTFDYVTLENNAFVVKINSSRVVQWGRYLSGTLTQAFNSVFISPNQYIYAAGVNDINGLIAKYDLNGNLQWIRQLRSVSAKTVAINSIRTNSQDTIHICGTTTEPAAGPQECFIVKLPGDGSLLGTYGDFIYEEVALTSGSITFSSSGGIFVSRTPTLTAKTSLTDAAATLTSSTFTI